MSVIVKYVDLDDNSVELANSGKLEGNLGEAVDYSTANEIKKLIEKNYILVDNQFDPNNEVHFYNENNQEYYVTFKHAHEVITAENLKYDLKKDDVQLIGKQVVHYIGLTTPISDNLINVFFNRKVIYDKVTKKKTFSDWRTKKKEVPPIATPAVLGYTPDKAIIGGEELTVEDPIHEYVVTYVPNKKNARKQKAEVKFIDLDSSNQEIFNSGELKGKPNRQISYNVVDVIKDLEQKNYELVNNGFDLDGETPVFGNSRESIQTFVVVLKHKIVKVNSDNPSSYVDKKLYEKEVSRKITFLGADKDTPKEVVQTANFKRSLTLDLVTNKIIPNGKYTTEWYTDETYPSVSVPSVSSYHTEMKEVSACPVVDHDIHVDVKYYPNGYLIPIDSNDNPLPNFSKKKLITNSIDPTKAIFPEIKANNVELKIIDRDLSVEDPKINYYVHYKVVHKYVPVDQKRPRNDVSSVAYKRIATARIHYQGAGNSTPADAIQTVQWNRTVTYDEVTQSLCEDGMYTTKWIANKDKFEAVPTPVIKGYGADIGLIGEHPVTKTDLMATITYRPLGKMIPVDVHHNKIENATHLTYVNDPYDPVRVLMTEEVPEVEGYSPVKKTVSVENPFEDIYVSYTLDPRYIPVNSDHPYRPIKPTLYSVPVKEIIKYQGADELTPINKIQAAKWTRTLTVNENDSKLVEDGKYTTPWKSDKKLYEEVKTPVIDGYHADKVLVKQHPVTKSNYEEVITYTKNGCIIPVDSKGIELPEVDHPLYITDPDDATKVIKEQGVPRIMNYIPEQAFVIVKKANKNIRVTYYTFDEMNNIKKVLNKVEKDRSNKPKQQIELSDKDKKIKEPDKIETKDTNEDKKRKSIFPWIK